MMQLHTPSILEGGATTPTLSKGHIHLLSGMTPRVAHEPVPVSLGPSPGTPGNTVLRSHPQM